MNKSDLVKKLFKKKDSFTEDDLEKSTNTILNFLSDTLFQGDRIEIRGFGSFALRFRKSRTGRNPKSGESVNIKNRYVPHFKPGKDFRESVKEAGNRIIA